MKPITLWVMHQPTAPYLRLLEQLPEPLNLIVGNTAEIFEHAPDPDAVFAGFNLGGLLRELWPRISRAKWLHSFSAGVEHMMFPELIESSITMTNAKGVFGRSLGEYAIAAALFFAKDVRRMIKSQEEGVWDSFEVIEELTGRTMGIVGYGGIGREAGKRAKAMGMRVIAVRRQTSAESPELDAVYSPGQLHEALPLCDYVVMAAPNTPDTRGMIGEAQLRLMKKTAVIMNLGRGPVIVEADLIRALDEGWIRGAALDVFNEEPLPAGHAFYRLKNLLLSAHCADHTPGWMEESVQFFVDNFKRFAKGQPLENVVDKRAGY